MVISRSVGAAGGEGRRLDVDAGLLSRSGSVYMTCARARRMLHARDAGAGRSRPVARRSGYAPCPIATRDEQSPTQLIRPTRVRRAVGRPPSVARALQSSARDSCSRSGSRARAGRRSVPVLPRNRRISWRQAPAHAGVARPHLVRIQSLRAAEPPTRRRGRPSGRRRGRIYRRVTRSSHQSYLPRIRSRGQARIRRGS